MEKKTTEFLKVLPLGQVLKTIPSGLFLVDRQQTIVYWNKEAERITGYSADEAIGQHCSFLEGIECGSGCGLYNPEINKPIIGANCHIRTKSGEAIFLSKNADYLRHEGVIIGGIESFVDLTQQKKLEQQLRRHADDLEATIQARTSELETERSRLSTLLEAMDDPTFITRPDYEVVYANRALREIFGDVTGMTCFKEIYRLDQPCSNCPMEQTLNRQTTREERLIPVNNRTYEILHTPILDGQGNILKLAVCRDITERKQAETDLINANQELDTFVHTVSHDLRTPLTPIIGYAEFLQTEYRDQLGPKVLEMLHDIELQGHKMLEIMEDLLELSRVGKLEPQRQEMPVQEVVLDVLGELQQTISEQEVECILEPLPGTHLPRTLLTQLFANLIRNALVYGCPKGGKIEIGGSRSDSTLRLFVRDFGPGIPETEREGVFELFFRGSTSQHTQGTGIGLATVKKVARLYLGKAWAEETPGGGCTLCVELTEPAGASTADLP